MRQLSRYIVVDFLLIIAYTTSSCSRLEESYSDRVCWGEGSSVPLECREKFVDFKCTENLQISTIALPKDITRITTNQTKNYTMPVVGKLFNQHGETPILVKNGSPWVTLHNDIDRILLNSGYEIDHHSSDLENRLDIDIVILDVRSDDPGLLDLKIKTRAVVTFKVTLLRNSGEIAWTEDFTGNEQIEVVYAYLKDSEEVLNRAYCQALRKFASAVTMENFVNSLGRTSN